MSEKTKTKVTAAEGEPVAAPTEEPKPKKAFKKDFEASAQAPMEESEESMGDDRDEPREPKIRRRGRAKVSYLTVNKIDVVDYKDIAILKRFLTDRAKILPRRQTGNTAKQQRMISNAIKRAREMALLPFVGLGNTDEGTRRIRRE